MSFLEKKEYDGILDKIAEVEEKIEQTEAEMAKAGSDFDKLQELTDQIDAYTAEYDELIERWSYLQELAEA